MKTDKRQSKIQHQVKLPIAMAFSVAMQGIQVRFGRSVVTIMGVVLGIAFLMAILTGQVIKSGVSEEQALRNEVRRMYNFLVVEMGPPRGRIVSLVIAGNLERYEKRLIDRLLEARAAEVRVALAPDVTETLPTGVRLVSPQELGDDAQVFLVLGEGEVDTLPWEQMLTGARYRLICFSRQTQSTVAAADANSVTLSRELRPEELEDMATERRKARIRNIWIIVISMMVTVIGITNSMLMSVTERFREIGTMKCLGALSAFIRQLFLIESSFVGLIGALLGAIVGASFSLIAYTVTYSAPLVFSSLNYWQFTGYFCFSVVVGLVLSVLAALYPARFASRMLPAHALRSNI